MVHIGLIILTVLGITIQRVSASQIRSTYKWFGALHQKAWVTATALCILNFQPVLANDLTFQSQLKALQTQQSSAQREQFQVQYLYYNRNHVYFLVD